MATYFNPRPSLKLSICLATLLAAPMVQSAPISKADFNNGKSQVSTTYTHDKASCKVLADNARDICMEEAKGKRNVARAELNYAHTEKPGDLTKVGEAKAHATYGVAKEKCDDMAGNDKSVCVKEAKAVQVKAMVNTKMTGDINEIRKDGAADKRDADYKVAAEKCDILAGDAKASCIAQAKTRFGKS